MTGPNAQVLSVARLCENLAQTVAHTLEHIRHELATNNGLKAATIDGFGSRTSDTTTTVEHAAGIRLELANHRTQIYDDIRTLALIIYSCQDTCHKAAGTRIPTETDKPRCYTGNLEGFVLPRYETDGTTLLPEDDRGWSDASCTNLPRRGMTGPCDACYARHRRWRALNGLKPLNNEIPAA